MERRRLGRTGLEVSVLGYGCGAVGGLMTRGDAADQERAVARAIELGINYFDTAPQYGDGASERNTGRVLKALGADVVLGTKVRIKPAERSRIGAAVTASLEASLQRLGRDSVDLFQLHNLIAEGGTDLILPPELVLNEVAPAFERLRQQGKTRFIGITALGDTASLEQVVGAGVFDTAQVAYNVLNPSAGAALPVGYPAQDYRQLLAKTQAAGMGVINIRVLAGGALSGTTERHPLGSALVEPIGSSRDYATDVKRATRLEALVKEGHAESLVDAGLRFAIANRAVSTVLVGYSTLDHLEYAAAAVARGPLPEAALNRLVALQGELAGEVR
ncbi:MAG TPA: aldo/keto reductase [Hyphomicrobiaceae bacterium]|nr:aldo/keto reductase [Hyphomicrobiaceae bacterium]